MPHSNDKKRSISWLTQLKNSLSSVFTRKHQQSWFMDKILALRHPGEIVYGGQKKGYCQGFSYMTMLFILASKRDSQNELTGLIKLEEMLKYLLSESPATFRDDIHTLEQKRLNIFQNVKSHIEQMGDNEIASEWEKLQRSEDINIDLIKKAKTISDKKAILIQHLFTQELQNQLSKNEYNYLEIPNFFDGIELFQNIRAHERKFFREDATSWVSGSRSIETMFPFLMPKELEDIGGIVVGMNKTGVFLKDDAEHQDELEIYFECVRNQFQHLTFPITLHLSANMHVLPVHYDPVTDKWIFTDANQKIGNKNAFIKTTSNVELAKLVREKLRGKNLPYIIMTTTLCTAHNHAETMSQQIDLLKINPKFDAIFQLDRKKMQAKSLSGDSWLSYEIDNANHEMVQKMHQAGYIEYDIHLDNAYTDLNIKENQFAAQYFTEQTTKVGNYFTRNRLLAAASELKKILDSTYLHPDIREIRTMQFQFLVQVFQNTPINEDAENDKYALLLAMLTCYIRWQYQGRNVSVLTAQDQTKYRNASDSLNAILSPIHHLRRELIEHPGFLLVDVIVSQDKVLGYELRSLTQELEKLHAKEEILNFFTEVFIKAEELTREKILESELKGVLIDAFQWTYQRIDPSVQKQIDYIIWHNTITPTLQKTLKEQNRDQGIQPFQMSGAQLVTLLSIFNSEKRSSYYETVLKSLPNIKLSAQELSDIMRFYEQEQSTEIYKIVRNGTPDIIKNAQDFNDLARFSPRILIKIMYHDIQDKLPAFTSNLENLINVLEVLDSEDRIHLYQTMRSKLETMFDSCKECNIIMNTLLPEEQFQDLNHLVVLHQLKKIFSNQSATALKMALENNNSIVIKAEIDMLIQHSQRANKRLMSIFFPNDLKKELIDVLAGMEPNWLEKINNALELDLNAKELSINSSAATEALELYVNSRASSQPSI